MLLFLQNTAVESRPRQAFVSYSHRQGAWKDRLMAALRPLEEQRQITAWRDRKLLPGQPWDGVIREEPDRSVLVLLPVGLTSSPRPTAGMWRCGAPWNA
jgi:hypothetical protein